MLRDAPQEPSGWTRPAPPTRSADATRGSSGLKAPLPPPRLIHTDLIHGENRPRTFGGETGDQSSRTRTRMVFVAALLFGHGASVMTEPEHSVTDMIGKYWSQLTSPGGTQSSSARRGSVDSWDERDNNSRFCSLDTVVEHEEQLLQQDVTRQIERCLTEAKASSLHCQVLLLPRRMTTRIGQDVVRSSADEPCGLRGASIAVYVEFKDGLKSVGSIFPDPSVIPTFELSVIFKAEKDDGWPPLKNIFDTNKVLKLRAEYRLVKRKLYSSASPVIHDFS